MWKNQIPHGHRPSSWFVLTSTLALLLSACGLFEAPSSSQTPTTPSPRASKSSSTGALTGVFYDARHPERPTLALLATQQGDLRWNLLDQVNQLENPTDLSAHWSGWLTAPQAGSYQFNLQASTTLQLNVNGQSVRNQQPVTLKAGQPLWVTISGTQLPSQGHLTLAWSHANQPSQTISGPWLSQNPTRTSLAPQTLAVGGQVISNSDFEDGLLGWTRTASPTTAVDLTAPGEGSSNALKVDASNWSNRLSFDTSDMNLVVPNARYRFEASIATGAAAYCQAGVAGYLASLKVNSDAATPFTKYSSEFTTIPNETSFNVYLTNYGSWYGKAGDCLFDNVQLTLIEAPLVRPNPFRNLVNNSEFEPDPTSGRPASWNVTGTPTGLLTPGYNSGSAFGLPAGVNKPVNGKQVIPSTGLKADTDYVLKVWMKGQRWSNCYVEVGDPIVSGQASGYNRLTISPQSSTEWKEHSILFHTTTPPKNVEIIVHGQGQNECAIDNLHFGPVSDDGMGPPDPQSGDDLIPAADITAVINASEVPPAVFSGSEVQFSGAGSVGNELTYHWNFGDGSSATGDPEASGDIAHEYAQPGYYTATLTVTDVPTNTVKTTTVPIAVMPDIHDMPSRRVTGYTTPVTLDVQFPVTGLSYEWKIDDQVVLQGPQATPALNGRGFHDVTLTIYNDRAGPNIERPILAQRQTRINNIVPPPDASIAGQQTAADTITFDGASRTSAVSPVTYEWDFGDGSTGQGAQISHAYPKDGRYGVTLTVTDAYGQQDKSYKVAVLVTRPTNDLNQLIKMHLGDGSIRSLALKPAAANVNNAPSAIRQAMQRDQQTKDNSVIYAYRSAPKSTSKTFSAQSLHTSLFAYPYAIPRNPELVDIQSKPTGYAPYFYAPSTLVTVNDQPKLRGDGWNFEDCDPIAPNNCPSARFNRQLFPNMLKEGINHHTLTFHSMNETYTFDTEIATFSGLRVPHVTVNVIPDTQLEDMEVKEYSFDNNGSSEFFAVVNVPESNLIVSNGVEYAPFVVPVYAVDTTGRLMTEVSGAFDAFFNNTQGIYSNGLEGVMVNGRSEIQVYLPVAQFADGTQQIDLTQVVVTSPNEACGFDGQFAHGGFALYGCQTVVATHQVPSGLVTDNLAGPGPVLSGQKLQAQAANCQSFYNRVSKDLLNRVGFGKDSQARRDFDASVKDYEGSVAGIVISILPFAGDGIDLIAQGYWCVTGKPADPVVVTLAVVGVGMDALTGVGDVTAFVKALYKGGGPIAQAAIRALIDEVKAGKRSPQQAAQVFLDSMGFLKRVGIKNINQIPEIKIAFELSAEAGGTALDAVKRYNFSYNKFADMFNPANGYPIVNLVKVAKYGMFAPETAKAMGKCGSECVDMAGTSTNLYVNLGSSGPASISKIEKDYKYFTNFGWKSAINKSYVVSVAEGCGLGLLLPQSPRKATELCTEAKFVVKHITSSTPIRNGPNGVLSDIKGGHIQSELDKYISEMTQFGTERIFNNDISLNGLVKYTFKGFDGAKEVKRVKTAFPDTIKLPDGKGWIEVGKKGYGNQRSFLEEFASLAEKEARKIIQAGQGAGDFALTMSYKTTLGNTVEFKFICEFASEGGKLITLFPKSSRWKY